MVRADTVVTVRIGNLCYYVNNIASGQCGRGGFRMGSEKTKNSFGLLIQNFRAIFTCYYSYLLTLAKDPDPYKYQVRMWTLSNTFRQ